MPQNGKERNKRGKLRFKWSKLPFPIWTRTIFEIGWSYLKIVKRHLQNGREPFFKWKRAI
jgi:hypothetical protein